MAYNPKSLNNLKPFKKGEKKSQAQKDKISATQKAKKSMQEIAKAVLDSSVNDDIKKKMKEQFPEMDESFFTTRLQLFSVMLGIAAKGERDSDRISAFNTIMAYAGETPELTLAKQMQEIKGQSYEDDPFSKSIKEMGKKKDV